MKASPDALTAIRGQEAAVELLRELARTRRIPPALIFGGVEGCGRTTAGRAFALMISCEKGIGCGACEACRAFAFGEGLTEIDVPGILKSDENKAEILRRELAAQAYAHRFAFRVVIIASAHRMSDVMQAAMLKAIEEPIPGVVYILVASHPMNLSATIRSRCQLIRFSTLESDVMAGILEGEKISVSGKERRALLEIAGGSLAAARLLLARYAGPEEMEKAFRAWGREKGLKRAELLERLETTVPILARRRPEWKEALLELDRSIAENAHVGLAYSVFDVATRRQGCMAE